MATQILQLDYFESLKRKHSTALCGQRRTNVCRGAGDGTKITASRSDGSNCGRREDRNTVQSNRYKEIKKGKWQGKLITGCWQDDKLYGECFFSWMSEWKTASAYTVAGIH